VIGLATVLSVRLRTPLFVSLVPKFAVESG
jgi:hypothetical protein